MIYGVDISNWQDGLDYKKMVANGVSFAILKATEGTGFKDKLFTKHYNGFKATGIPLAAYHYVKAGDPEGQLRNIKEMVPTTVAIIPDVEDGAGDLTTTRRLIDLLVKAGYKVPLIYIPEWYWKKIGSPSLAGLPKNWWSWYPDNNGMARTFDQGISMVPARIWSGFGGLPVEIVQFTSTGRIPGYGGNLDLNAYRGSQSDIKKLFNGDGGVDELSWNDKFADPETGEEFSAGTWLVYANKKAEWALEAVESLLGTKLVDWSDPDGEREFSVAEWLVGANLKAEKASAESAALKTVVESLLKDRDLDVEVLLDRVSETVKQTVKDSTINVSIDVLTDPKPEQSESEK